MTQTINQSACPWSWPLYCRCLTCSPSRCSVGMVQKNSESEGALVVRLSEGKPDPGQAGLGHGQHAWSRCPVGSEDESSHSQMPGKDLGTQTRAPNKWSSNHCGGLKAAHILCFCHYNFFYLFVRMASPSGLNAMLCYSAILFVPSSLSCLHQISVYWLSSGSFLVPECE